MFFSLSDIETWLNDVNRGNGVLHCSWREISAEGRERHLASEYVEFGSGSKPVKFSFKDIRKNSWIPPDNEK